jgi:hypothetical protein
MTLGRILLLLAVLAAALVQARAAPLDAESCIKLMNEHEQLEQAGVEADMAKGPEWGKANLLPEKLDRIRRFIEIEEQLLFRCRQKSLVNLPAAVEAPASDGKEQDKKKNAVAPPTTEKSKAPPAAAKKGVQPAKKAAVHPAAKQPPKQPKQAPGAAKPPAKAKAAAKQPAAANTEPSPSTAAAKRAPKAKAEDD